MLPNHKFIDLEGLGVNVGIIPISPNVNDPYKYKYQGQERQDDFGLNWDSFKWRNYDYAIGRFFNIDPLAEDYPYNSTYAFQENKMGLGRELEGLELVYREGTSPEFKNKFGSTVQYMNEKGTSEKMAKLNTLGKTELVDNTGKGSFYNSKEEAIYWDPTGGMETTEGHLLSPATILDHEVDHALQAKENPQQFDQDKHSIDGFDPEFSTKEEKRVITGSEQSTALKHGEIKEGEVTRKDHLGFPKIMPDPTSTDKAIEGEFNMQLEDVILE